MDEEKFDCIVVGGGLAGLSAAYKMILEGLNVLVVERGNYSGAKNMTGGRIYTHSLEKLFPNFREEAPLERKITNEKISILTPGEGTTFSYSRENHEKNTESYSVLRATFDQWLAEQVENAGGFIVSGVQVQELLLENGKVVGVKAGEDEMYSDCVILADGVNSLLAESLKVRPRVTPEMVAVGAKDVYELPAQVIEDRFGNKDGEGTAWLSIGEMTHGLMGGGFIYTNKDTVSVGIVVGLEHIDESPVSIDEMMQEFVNNPVISPLLKDAKLIEHSGHMVPEAGLKAVGTLSGDGFIIVGDAAGLCINLGYTVRGMDLAIESGIYAAETVIEANKKQDFSSETMKSYDAKIKSAPSIGKDMELYKKLPEMMENRRIFAQYPTMINSLMKDVFAVSDQGAQPIMKKMMKHVKTVGLINVMKDAWKGVRSL